MNSEFLQALLRSGALRFGDFITKAGRRSPYFVNFGAIQSGAHLSSVGKAYADVLKQCFGEKVTLVFGPAYKGIPLVSAVVLEALHQHQLLLKMAYNRKEAKDHGEGGSIVGSISKSDKIVLIDDVISRGTSVEESFAQLGVHRNQVIGLIVGVDRCEKGLSGQKASLEIQDRYGIEVKSITTIFEILETLTDREFDQKVWLNQNDANAVRGYIDMTFNIAST